MHTKAITEERKRLRARLNIPTTYEEWADYWWTYHRKKVSRDDFTAYCERTGRRPT